MKNFDRTLKYTLTIFCFFLLLSSCEKDDPVDDPANNDPVNTSGRFSNYLTCEIIDVPGDVGLSNYYSKFINCSGIPVIGSSEVPDEALYLADESTEFILTGLGAIRSQLIKDGNYIALYPVGSTLFDLPENFSGGPNSTGVYEWNESHRAIGSDVASLVCAPEAGFGHTLIHELGHMVDIGGIRRLNGGFLWSMPEDLDFTRLFR